MEFVNPPQTSPCCQARERGLQLDTVAQNSVAWSTCAFGSRDDQLKNKKEGSLRQNLPRWNSIGGIRPYCFLVKISLFKTWLLEVITAMGRGLHWPLAVLSLEQVHSGGDDVAVRHCKSGNKTLRTHGAMALSMVSSLLNMASWFMMVTSCYISFSLIFWHIVSNTDAAMMLFCCLEALKANLARVRSYRAAIVGGSQNVWPVSMGADGFWPEAAVTSAGWPMALWQLVCGEKSAVHVVLVNSLWRKKKTTWKKNRKAALFLHRKSHVTEWLLEDYSVLPLGKGVQLGVQGVFCTGYDDFPSMWGFFLPCMKPAHPNLTWNVSTRLVVAFPVMNQKIQTYFLTWSCWEMTFFNFSWDLGDFFRHFSSISLPQAVTQ